MLIDKLLIFSKSLSLKSSAPPKIILLVRSVLIVALLAALIKPVTTLVQRVLPGASGLNHSLLQDKKSAHAVGGAAPDSFIMPPLFGKKTTSPDILLYKKVEQPSAPRIYLSLKGVIGSSGKGATMAIINTIGGRGEDEVFAPGETLPGGGTLTKIFLDRVIISKGEAETVLYLDSESDQDKAKVKSKIISTTVSGYRRRSTVDTLVRQNIESSFVKDRLANLTDLSKEVGVQIYKENSLQIGYRLTSTKGSTLLATLGLKPGDIVTEINGIKMLNIRQGLKALSGMRNAGHIRLAVKRGGVEKNFIYSLQ